MSSLRLDRRQHDDDWKQAGSLSITRCRDSFNSGDITQLRVRFLCWYIRKSQDQNPTHGNPPTPIYTFLSFSCHLFFFSAATCAFF